MDTATETQQHIFQRNKQRLKCKRAQMPRKHTKTSVNLNGRNIEEANRKFIRRNQEFRKLLAQRPVSLDRPLVTYNLAHETLTGHDINGDKIVVTDVKDVTQDRNSPRLLNTSGRDKRAVSERIVRESEYALPVISTAHHYAPVIRTENAFHSTHSFFGDNLEKVQRSTSQAFQSSRNKNDDCETISVIDDHRELFSPIEDDEFNDRMGNIVISPFPLEVDDEIHKHQEMNDDIMAHTRLANDEYLKRMKLMRRNLSRSKLNVRKRIVKEVPTKPTLKRMPSQYKWTKPTQIDPQPKSVKRRDIHEKASKVIQCFKYSHAMENYYSDREHCSSQGDDDSEDDEELYGDFQFLNGWLIHNLGHKVLNVKARSMPSCNPFSERNRIRQVRSRAFEENQSFQRNMSRESLYRQTPESSLRFPRVKFQDIVKKLEPTANNRMPNECSMDMKMLFNSTIEQSNQESIHASQKTTENSIPYPIKVKYNVKCDHPVTYITGAGNEQTMPRTFTYDVPKTYDEKNDRRTIGANSNERRHIYSDTDSEIKHILRSQTDHRAGNHGSSVTNLPKLKANVRFSDSDINVRTLSPEKGNKRDFAILNACTLSPV